MHHDEMSELTESWRSLQRLTSLRVIRTEKDLEVVTELADKLADEVGDNTSHPLFPLFDLVTEMIGVWEACNLPEIKCKISKFSSRVCRHGTRCCETPEHH